MKLSVCVATYNEKPTIHYALDSTYAWVDEVIIVDGGSTDGTPELVLSYGDKVKLIEVQNDPMFHRMKQRAIDAATGDWVLQLDADEEIPLELRNEILSKITDATSPHFAYQIPRKNYFLGRFLMKGGVYPDYTIRLYQRGSMYLPCENLHENAEPTKSMEAQTMSESWLGTLSSGMHHYSDPTFARYLARWQRYNLAEARRLAQLDTIAKMQGWRYAWWLSNFALRCSFILPVVSFFQTYVRHKGFMDSWQGFVFHFMSAIRWWGILYCYLTHSTYSTFPRKHPTPVIARSPAE